MKSRDQRLLKVFGRPCFVVGLCLLVTSPISAREPLPGTRRLELRRPLADVMVEGIHRFCMRELARAAANRRSRWNHRFGSLDEYAKSVAANRRRFRTIIGAIDRRVTIRRGAFELIQTLDQPSLMAQSKQVQVHRVRWPVLPGVTAEGLMLIPSGTVRSAVVALPDADWTPEAFCGLQAGVSPQAQLARRLAHRGCLVVVPTLIDRDDALSGHRRVRYTNQPHREFIYRQAFELGRHVIGYEVQKVRAAIDLLRRRRATAKVPVGVVGVGEGGLLAMYAAAVDTRIDTAWICGYFQRRAGLWEEPIYRNVWGLLSEFGDAEIAALIAPRRLLIEACAVPTVTGPPAPRPGRSGAAPGRIRVNQLADVESEFAKAAAVYEKVDRVANLKLIKSVRGSGTAGSATAMKAYAGGSGLRESEAELPWRQHAVTTAKDIALRQRRQFDELQTHVQDLLRQCGHERRRAWRFRGRKLPDWKKQQSRLRKRVYDQMIGRLPHRRLPPAARSRRVLKTDKYVGYEVVMDVFPDVIAGGILLIPRGKWAVKAGERRPVVVCQHGLEGTAMDTIAKGNIYRSFAAELCKRGYVVFSPQNPYIGLDKFRLIQRKSNPLRRSLYSYIIPQHEQIVAWLGSLPFVDKQRIGFYGLSYGGKTAMRVPPFVSGYALCICSGDFTQFARSIATNEERYGYIFTREFEIPEWNMGHVADYAQLAKLMIPRPFMVEQGYRDGGAPPRWVAAEYEPVRRLYRQLGIGSRTDIEFFDGGHRINGQGTFRFLDRHLKKVPRVSVP